MTSWAAVLLNALRGRVSEMGAILVGLWPAQQEASGWAHEFTVSKKRVWFLSRGLAEVAVPSALGKCPLQGGHLPKAHG